MPSQLQATAKKYKSRSNDKCSCGRPATAVIQIIDRRQSHQARRTSKSNTQIVPLQTRITSAYGC